MRQHLRLVLSGGGTGGHIVPNIALIQELKERYPDGLELLYIGSRHGMEKKMMRDLGVPYKGIFCGKFRRYFSWQNFLDFFLIPIGVIQSFFILLFFRPNAVFCKGGFVSFPVAFGAWIARIHVILHESDVIPGLSNRLAGRFASTICVSFDETKKYFSGKKRVVVTGNPVRKELLQGNVEQGLRITGFDAERPIVLLMGGSLGANFINELVWNNLEKLTEHYNVVHICGKGKKREMDLPHPKRYCSYEFVGQDMKHLYAISSAAVTRAGANTLSELALLGIPSLLIPLSKKVSRGDQFDNAEAFSKKHKAFILNEDEFDEKLFFQKLQEFAHLHRDRHHSAHNPADQIISLLEKK